MQRLLRHDLAYASFWLGVTTLIFFAPVVLGLQSLAETVPTFYSHPTPNPSIKTPWQVDGGWHTIDVMPLVTSEIQMMKDGTPPLWGAYSGGGEPLVNNAVNVYYPLRLIFFSLFHGAQAFDFYFLLRFLIAGLGMFFYLRAIGLERRASLWGGIAYAFTGYFILYLTYPFLDIDALVPWALLAVEYHMARPDVRSTALIGLIMAMMVVVGQPQSAIIATLFIALYTATRITQTRRTLPPFRVWFGHLILLKLIIILLAAPFILDFLTAYNESASIAEWQAKGFLTFQPLQLLHFIVTPSMMAEVAASGHMFDSYQTIIPYLGLSVVALFFLSFFLKQKPKHLLPLYIWTGFVILKNAGFFLVHWISCLPILNQIGWYKAYGPMAAAIVIGGAVAFDRLIKNDAFDWRNFYRLIIAIPLIFVLALIAFPESFARVYVPNFDFANRSPEAIAKATAVLKNFPQPIEDLAVSILQGNATPFAILFFLIAAFFLGLTLLIIRFIQNGKHRERWVIALLVLTAFELWFYMPKVRDGFSYFDPYKEPALYVGFLQNEMKENGVSRTFSIGDVFRGHAGELYQIQKAQNNSSLKPGRYFAFFPEAALEDDSLSATITTTTLTRIPKKFFDAYNVRYIISEESIDEKLGFSLAYDEDMKLYENSSALPKAYVSFQKQTAISPEEARRFFYDEAFNPHESVVLEDRGGVTLSSTTLPEALADAVVVKYQANEVVLKANADRDGVLVLTDLFYPGWNAYIDGKRVPVYPANVMFRGIYLPVGEHEVRFVYEPWWLVPSFILSLLTLLGLFVLATFPDLKRHFDKK